MPDPTFFNSSAKFRRWLEENHQKETELLVGYYKVNSGKRSMTWSESVDEALCFGWIDGVRRRINDEAYSIRFSPRRENSIWSAINIRKFEELERTGRIRPAGAAAFKKRTEKRSAVYSYENEPKTFDPEFEKQFRRSKKGWSYFKKQPSWYQRLAIHYVMSAKQNKTRTSRLEKLILASEAGNRL
jgi:uncharacterized protein YdeI (YjbR/CyaY-like superfamily)